MPREHARVAHALKSILAAILVMVVAMLGIETAHAEAEGGPSHGRALECKEVVFIGVRESGANLGHGETVWATYEAMRQALGGHRSVEARWLNYPAHSVDMLGPPENDPARWHRGMEAGAVELQGYLDEARRCNSWIILVGYSQGALVIRLALDGFTSAAPQIQQVAGVVLFGDPARSSGDGLPHLGTGLSEQDGIYVNWAAAVGDVPRTVGYRASWCNTGDDVCENDGLVNMADDIAWDVWGPHGVYRHDGSTAAAGRGIARSLLELGGRPKSESGSANEDSGSGGTVEPSEPGTPGQQSLTLQSGLSVRLPNGRLAGRPVDFSYVVRNNGSTTVRADVFSIAIRGPGNEIRDVECRNGRNISLRPRQTFTCTARRSGLTATGQYTAWADWRQGVTWHQGELGGNATFNLVANASSNLAPNGSFEQGNGHWRKVHCPGGCNLERTVNRTVYLDRPARAHGGRGFLEANTARRDGSVGQDIAIIPRAGEYYWARVWARTTRSTPARMTLALWAIGANDHNAATTVEVGNQWTPVDVVLRVRAGGHRNLRIEFYMGETNVQYNFDDVVLTRHSSAPTVNVSSPFGQLEEVAALGPESIRVSGWAVDKSAPSAATDVEVTVGGRRGQNGVRTVRLGPARRARPDIQTRHPWAGREHGFSETISISGSGDQLICVYSRNLGAGSDTLLGCRTVVMPEPSPSSEVTSPEPPPPPMCAGDRSPSSLTVQWIAPDPNPLLEGFEAQVSADGEAWQSLPVLGPTERKLVYTRAVPDASYRFRIRLVAGGVTSDFSNPSGPCVRHEGDRELPTPILSDGGFSSFASDQYLTSAHADVFRLYWAFFGREPDLAGAEYWADQVDRCASLSDITWVFGNSAEFQQTYGILTNDQYVELVYNNVLSRYPDAEGRFYWRALLDSTELSRSEMMLYFSVSEEFRTQRAFPSDARHATSCS